MQRTCTVAILAGIAAFTCAAVRPLSAGEAAGGKANASTQQPPANPPAQLNCTWSEALAKLLNKIDAIEQRVDAVDTKLAAIEKRVDRVTALNDKLEFIQKLMDEIRYEPVVEETWIGGRESPARTPPPTRTIP